MVNNEREKRQGKDRKSSNLQKAVKWNWNKAHWKVKHCEKHLEAKLAEYHVQRQKVMKFFDLEKSQLVKKYVDTTGARLRHVEKDVMDAKIARDSRSSKMQASAPNNAMTDKKRDENSEEETEPIKASSDRWACLREQSERVTRKISGSSRPSNLPEIVTFVRQVTELDTKIENVEIANRTATQRFSVIDNVQRRLLGGARKASSWEMIGGAGNQTPFFPEIGNRVQRMPLTLNRSKSYTIGDNSDSFIPTRERKKGVYQLQSVPITDNGQRSRPDSKENSERVSSLEEQFEKLQSCRYLRSS